MSEQAAKPKHEFVLSLSDSGLARANALLDRLGHRSLQRLVARGLELVEWVENQQDDGRTIAGVVYGDEVQVFELRERQELIGAAPAHAVPSGPSIAPQPVHQGCPAEDQASVEKLPPEMSGDKCETDIPAPSPTAPEPNSAADKVAAMAARGTRDRKRAPKPTLVSSPSRTDNRRMAVVNAHRHSDEGPVISLARARSLSRSLGPIRAQISPPIAYQDKPLPGVLTLEHQTELQNAYSSGSAPTHFSMNEADGFICFYEFIPPKGWHQVTPGTLMKSYDPNMFGSMSPLYPLKLAIDYLMDLEAAGGLVQAQQVASA